MGHVSLDWIILNGEAYNSDYVLFLYTFLATQAKNRRAVLIQLNLPGNDYGKGVKYEAK